MPNFTERQEHKIEIIPPFNILQCRRADIIEKDGVEVGRTYHRHCRVPGDEMKSIAAALWTEQIIAAYNESINNNNS
jgi:hypothetical protein